MDVEHGTHPVGENLALRVPESGISLLYQLAQGAVQVAQAARLHIGDLVDPGQDALRQLVHLLAGPSDQVPVASPVVVIKAGGVADRGRHREVPPPAEALQPVRDHRRIDAAGDNAGLGRNFVRSELGEERTGEDPDYRPVFPPLLARQVAKQLPCPVRVAAGIRDTAISGIARLPRQDAPTGSRALPRQR